jgi:hypothetical protein
VVAAALLGLPGQARANPSARLVYARGANASSCPTEAEVRRAVAERLGYDPFVLWAVTTIVVDVSRHDNRYWAVVRLLDDQGIERGTRRLFSRSAQCADIISTLALTISIVVDPLSLRPTPRPPERPPPPPIEEKTRPPVPPPPPPPVVTVRPAAPRPTHPQLRGFAGLATLAAFLPEPAAGAAVTGGVRWRALSVELEAGGIVHATSDPQLRGVGPIRLDGSSVGLSLLPCVWIGPAFACARGGVERIEVSGEVARPRQSWAIDWNFGARAGARIALSANLALRPFAGVVVRPLPPSVTIDASPVAPPPFQEVSGEVGIASTLTF